MQPSAAARPDEAAQPLESVRAAREAADRRLTANRFARIVVGLLLVRQLVAVRCLGRRGRRALLAGGDTRSAGAYAYIAWRDRSVRRAAATVVVAAVMGAFVLLVDEPAWIFALAMSGNLVFDGFEERNRGPA